MSPEPTQDASEEELNVQNVNQNIRIPFMSEVNDDDPYHAGYTLLPDNPNESTFNMNDDEDEDEDEEWLIPSTMPNTIENYVDIEPNVSTEVLNVWSSTCNQSTIDLDSEKISQVKNLMASFSLPNSVIPEWASKISEDQWKNQLMEKISEIQKKNPK